MSYRFATAAQFDSCLFDRADRGSRGAAGLRPFAPFAHTSTLYASAGAHAPAITRSGEILWRDDGGRLHRLPACADAPEAFPAPRALGEAARIIANARGLWVASGSVIELYEEETLARLMVVQLPDERIIDLAGNGQDGVFALVERDGVSQAVPVDCIGRIGESVIFEGITQATAFVYLKRAKRFVILARQRLHFYRVHSIPVAAMRPCFTAHALGSDGNSRVFLAGADGLGSAGVPPAGPGASRSQGGETPPSQPAGTPAFRAFVLSFDAEGNALGEVPLETPATGVAANRDNLVVTAARGVLRFRSADTVPDGAGEVRSALVTPMLQSPDREDARRWLRIEAAANLSAGASLEIAFAATDDAEVRDRLAAIAADASLSPSQRIRKMRGEPEVWRAPVVFHGAAQNVAAPLFDVRERYLWVSISLSAAAGAQLPELTQLDVLYPGRSLMEHLPAIYQRAEAQPGSFLRSLVGVLETTTHDLDARIAAMGTLIHPSTAPDEWLDFVARWLGLPWDDALTSAQKKAIVARAPELAGARGTRAGLEALLESLMPDTPRKFRVTDATADFGFAVIGGDGCAGSTLPAMLGGYTRWSAELDSRSVLGFMRLPCAGQRDDGVWRLAGKIRIEIAATAEERKAWEPWLLALITEMVPVTVRVELRWIGAHALRGDRLGGEIVLEGTPAAHLGSGAVTGLARLPDRGARLSAAGPDLGTRLR
jgi:phage tail-like protein